MRERVGRPGAAQDFQTSPLSFRSAIPRQDVHVPTEFFERSKTTTSSVIGDAFTRTDTGPQSFAANLHAEVQDIRNAMIVSSSPQRRSCPCFADPDNSSVQIEICFTYRSLNRSS